MKVPYKLESKHVQDAEVKFQDGVLSTSIRVDRKNRGLEEIGYSWARERYVEKTLAHRHGPTTYQLENASDDLIEVLNEEDAHFQNASGLIEKYADTRWCGYQTDHHYWEGQKSILVGRCDGQVVSIACLDLRFISEHSDSRTKFLSIGIGPFFVPKQLRARAHSIEMSIAISHLSTVLFISLCRLMTLGGSLGGSVYEDYQCHTDEDEVHPFCQQVYDKLKVVHQMLGAGQLPRWTNNPATITFLPVILER